MHAHTAKQEAIEAIEQLPHNLALDEIVYRRYVLNEVRQGMQDIETGRTLTRDALAHEVEQW